MTNQTPESVIAEVIEYHADAIDTHGPGCYKNHAACLAVKLRDMLREPGGPDAPRRAVRELIAEARGFWGSETREYAEGLVSRLADALEARQVDEAALIGVLEKALGYELKSAPYADLGPVARDVIEFLSERHEPGAPYNEPVMSAPQAESSPTSSYISPSLPGMIRNLWKSDPSENSVRTALKLAGDLIQELIDLRAANMLREPSDAAIAEIALVRALAEQWNATPDYVQSDYDKGRVDQRHNMTEQLLAALDGAPEPEWEYGYRGRYAVMHPTKAGQSIETPEITQRTPDNWLPEMGEIFRRRPSTPAGPWLPVEGEKP